MLAAGYKDLVTDDVRAVNGSPARTLAELLRDTGGACASRQPGWALPAGAGRVAERLSASPASGERSSNHLLS
jgi:hypothetical protein